MPSGAILGRGRSKGALPRTRGRAVPGPTTARRKARPMRPALQLVGAVLILAPFAWAQFGSLTAHSRVYLRLNLLGSALLAVLALIGSQWGFLLLEGSWAAVALAGLLERRRSV